MKILRIAHALDTNYELSKGSFYKYLLDSLSIAYDGTVSKTLSKLSVALKRSLTSELNPQDYEVLELLSSVIDLLHELITAYIDAGINDPIAHIESRGTVLTLQSAKTTLENIKAITSADLLAVYSEMYSATTFNTMLPITTFIDNKLVYEPGSLNRHANKLGLNLAGICYITSRADYKAIFPKGKLEENVYPIVISKNSPFCTEALGRPGAFIPCPICDLNIPVVLK